jgi:hypothetical protein
MLALNRKGEKPAGVIDIDANKPHGTVSGVTLQTDARSGELPLIGSLGCS